MRTNRTPSGYLATSGAPPQGTPPGVRHPGPAHRGRDPLSGVAPGRPWVQLSQNRFWLLIPILVLDLVLVGRLPPPLAPGSLGPDIPGWLTVSETVLRGVVFGVPLLMPLSPRARRTKPALAVYSGALTAYVAAWVAVVWAPTSAWSISAVRFTALAWTSVLLFTGIGLRSELRFFPRYRPWMYLGAATLFTVVHTLHMAIIWDFHY